MALKKTVLTYPKWRVVIQIVHLVCLYGMRVVVNRRRAAARSPRHRGQTLHHQRRMLAGSDRSERIEGVKCGRGAGHHRGERRSHPHPERVERPEHRLL